MAGGSEINNELTLDVSQFTSGLERATKKLESFNSKLDSLDTKSEKLEKDFKDLGTNANQAAKSMGAIGDGSKHADQALNDLIKDTKKAQRAFESMDEWTSHYGKSLDQLRPKMGAITKSQKELHSVTAKTTAEEAKALEAGIQNRVKDLANERQIIQERIKARKAMLTQLEQIERRAETSAAFARADAYKINPKTGKETPRYRGKNISKQRELEAEISSYQKQADLARQQKSHITAIVGEMHYRNAELKKAIAGEHELLTLNESQLTAQRAARQEAIRLGQEKKAQAKEAAAVAKAVEIQTSKDILAAQRNAHKELMAMKREEMKAHKEMAAFAVGAAAGGTTAAGVHQIADYQNVDSRVKAINLSNEEYERFKEKSWNMAAEQKFLSRTESMQTRLDALTAIGYNKEPTIDATVGSASRNAYILRSLGYEQNDFSDVVKNLYGFAEARQVMNDPNKVNESFDIARRIGVASGGKIKMADIETVARNIGDLRQTMSGEGWVKLAAVMEQFKTAGGGNGGGGGVAGVGTIFKMMSLYASGKPLTNGAAMDLLGADVMNDTFSDGTTQNFKNTKEANAAFVKAVKYAGFKDTEAMSKDPVKFFVGIRGQLLDYMMQDGQFKKFFGADAQKHSYDKKGNMIGADGKVVDENKQDDVENAAFKRFFARMGLSNKAIDGMLLTTNRKFAERSYHAADTAMNGQDEFQMMEDLSQNWTANIQELKASLADFAITFEPLLRTLSAIPKATSEVIRGFSEFGKEHNGIATLALGFLGLKVAMLATKGPLGYLVKGLLATGTGAKASQGFMEALKASFMGTSKKAAETGQAVAGMAGATAASSKKAGESLAGNMTAGATQATKAVTTARFSILSGLGMIVNWAGWLTLAGMMGWAIGKWISDINVGSITIGQHCQNLFNNIFTGWDMLCINMHSAWQGFLSAFGAGNDAVRREIAQTKKEIQERNEDMKIRGGTDKANYDTKKYTKSVSAQLEAQGVTNYNAKDSIGKTVTIDGKKIKLTANDVENVSKIFSQNSRYGDTDKFTKDGYTSMPKLANSELGNHFAGGYNAALHGGKKPITNEPQQTHVPNSAMPGQSGNNITAPTLPSSSGSSNRKEFTPLDAFSASMAALKEENLRDNSRVLELMGQPANYSELAKAAFAKEWMTGKLDDGRDPSSRKFATRAFDKSKSWNENDIDWSNPQVQQWLSLKSSNLKQDGVQKSLEFAAGKIGEAGSRLEDALEDYELDTDANSSEQAKAKREYGKFEKKNPTAIQNNPMYDEMKLISLSQIAGANYASMAKDLREQNKSLDDQLLENDTQAMRNAEDRRIESETKKLKSVQDALQEQLNLLSANGNTEDKLYQKLLKAKEQGEKDFTKFLENQEKLRLINTRSAYDQTMAQWRKLEDNINSVMGSFGERAGTDIWDIITGDNVFNLGDYFGDYAKELGGAYFKKVWGEGSRVLMGDGGATNVVDMAKGLLSGQAVSEDGKVGQWLNKMRGMSNPTGDVEVELEGDDATNANTDALVENTQALLAQSMGATASQIGSSDFVSGLFGAENVYASDPINGTGGILDNIMGTNGVPSMKSGDFSYAFGDGSSDGIGGGLMGQDTAGGLLSSVKTGFSNLFASSGEGGVFSNIKSGFENLFSSNGGLMGKIGGSFGSILGSLGSAIKGALGGSSSGGGWVGAVASIASSFFANGGAFGTTHAFANGGAFTNKIVNSPTMFKFANGGSFNQGVMGEAGPEAVMPLQRDGSGRLGVAVNGGMGGDSSVVNISINVSNDGSSSESSSDSGSNWNGLAGKVKSLVQEEIVKQKRPGGMLRTTN